MVVVDVADCSGGGDGHMLMSLLFKTCCRYRCQIRLGRYLYQVKGFCADVYRLTTKAISQDFCTIRNT